MKTMILILVFVASVQVLASTNRVTVATDDAVAILAAVPSAVSIRNTRNGYSVTTPSGTRTVYRTPNGYYVEGGNGAPNQQIIRTKNGYRIENSDVRIRDYPLIRLQLHVAAGMSDDPRTYRAALILEERVRGVDYSEITVRRHYKEVLPKGWHENILDPVRSADDRKQNRHEALNDFDPVDLKDFLAKVCRLWKINLPQGEEELL